MLSRFRGVIVARTLVFVQAALLAAVHAGRAEEPCKDDLHRSHLAKPEPPPRRIVVRVAGDSLAPLIEKPMYPSARFAVEPSMFTASSSTGSRFTSASDGLNLK